jgi:hypothetical protein
MKRYSALVLCVLLVFSLALSGCNGSKEQDPTQSADAAYKVTVVDGLGNAYTEKLIVKFMQGGKQVAMGAINAQGTFEKVLPRGEYDIEIASTNAELECHFLATKLTKDVTETQVVMAYAPTSFDTIIVNSVTSDENMSYNAALVSAGSSYIELNATDRVYALFAPTQAGTYEFSVSNDDASIGYYGAPHFVQSNNVAENVDGNKFTMSISSDMVSSGNTGTTVLVIGLDAKEGKDGCILNIKRIGEPAWSIENVEWTNYVPKTPIKEFKMESSVELIPFDITASTDTYKLVLNEDDGTYHLGTANGPKVYIQLAKAVYGICMKDMVGEIVYDADGILIPTGTSPFRYQSGDNKDNCFKEDYTDMMRQAVTAVDKATGVYPLTDDFFYALPMGIQNKGWCTEGTINYLFKGVDVNPEIAWMFLLCHEEGEIPVPPENPDAPVTPNPGPEDPSKDPNPSGPIEDNKDEPIIIGSTLNFDAEVKANHIVYFDLMHVNDTTLTIKSKDAYVIYNGKTYQPKNGVVTVPNLYSQYTNVPVSIQIGNKGTSDATFAVVLTYPEGHRENPIKLSVGALTTKQKSGDFDGTYYTFTAATAGTLTIKVDSTTKGTYAGVTITKVVDGIPYMFSLEPEVGQISVELAAGDMVEVNISATTDIIGTYPISTIKSTVSFA